MAAIGLDEVEAGWVVVVADSMLDEVVAIEEDVIRPGGAVEEVVSPSEASSTGLHPTTRSKPKASTLTRGILTP